MLTLVQTSLVPSAGTRSALPILSARAMPALSVLLLAAIAPFETPIFTVGPLTLTTVELAALAAVGASLAAILYARPPFVWRTPITQAVIVSLLVLYVAAALSPIDRGNALRFAARMTMAAAIFLVTVNAVRSRAQARAVVCTMLAAAVAISIVAVLEAAQVRAVLNALTIFRPGFHVVGGQLRATSTMLYPTIASMYLEIVFALGVWLLLEPRRGRAVVFAALVIIGAGIIATFTRAGLIAMASALALVGLLRFLEVRRFDRDHVRLAALAASLGALVILSRSPDVLLTRLRTEGSQDWYGAAYSAPASLQMRTAGDYEVLVTVENTGRVIWDSSSEPMFAMSYHWLRAGSEAVVQFDGWRTAFPEPVAPNARVTLPVNVRAPGEPGDYVLVWDVVHEQRAWLSTEGVTPGRTAVTVNGERVAATANEMSRLPPANVRADRFTLWRAALAIAADRPLLGVGPDNFRLAYGRYAQALDRRSLGEGGFDSRVHANNLYLETLAGTGVIGFAVLLWLLATAAAALIERWRQAAPADAARAAAFCAVCVVIAGHGLVDTFLSFTTTYVMFALAAGLAFAEYDHANRV